MHFATHSELAGFHATLSPSNYHWTNYSDEKLVEWFQNRMEAARGTALHAFAFDAIKLGIKLPRNSQTLNQYVNDALGYRMIPEQILYYSSNCFGTADAVSYKGNLLRIHDLKNGVTKASIRQLEVYTSIFCLEYGFKPSQIKVELRIYQNDDVDVYIPEVDDITHIMDRIITFDRQIESMKAEALS